jgi:hypothetical protein
MLIGSSFGHQSKEQWSKVLKFLPMNPSFPLEKSTGAIANLSADYHREIADTGMNFNLERPGSVSFCFL